MITDKMIKLVKDKLDDIADDADVTPSWVPSSDPSYASQSYVGTQITNLIGGAPGTLDTLKEIRLSHFYK